MQLMYSSITQSRLKTSVVFYFFPTQVFLIFDTPPPHSQVLLRTFDICVQSSLLPYSVQTFNAYPDSKHF